MNFVSSDVTSILSRHNQMRHINLSACTLCRPRASPVIRRLRSFHASVSQGTDSAPFTNLAAQLLKRLSRDKASATTPPNPETASPNDLKVSIPTARNVYISPFHVGRIAGKPVESRALRAGRLAERRAEERRRRLEARQARKGGTGEKRAQVGRLYGVERRYDGFWIEPQMAQEGRFGR
jgi:hypothetical protein